MSIGVVKFAEWLPDLPALDNPGMTEAKNVIPSDSVYKSFLPVTGIGDALTAAPMGGVSAGGAVASSVVGMVPGGGTASSAISGATGAVTGVGNQIGGLAGGE